MALKPVTFKLEEAELKKLEREAKASPSGTRSAYVRDIVLARNKPPRKMPMPSPNN